MSTSTKSSGNIMFTLFVFIALFIISLVVRGCNALVDYISEDNISTQTQTIVDFEKKLYDIEQKTKSISTKVETEISQMENYILPSLDTIREAKNTFESVSNEYDDLAIPDGLSDEREAIIKETKNAFRDAYKLKSTAMYWLEQYILDRQTESIVNYKESIDLANYFLTRGVTSIVDLEHKLGVDLSKTMYKGK
ncbi:hypothetical protein QO009_004096 [Brevibacillus aydinogluensis]|uniref:hypothetical protein n=1 Tax=Brevibacillus aydinogluensis TaxID=927786 RepID=UPI00289372EA|nr:hypothetical protein [Brevibacillus aydinogluensis]MDT3418171.1 hypothetical protein [Brevibacillus aydinogluensis]